jgi:hypothetical protein
MKTLNNYILEKLIIKKNMVDTENKREIIEKLYQILSKSPDDYRRNAVDLAKWSVKYNDEFMVDFSKRSFLDYPDIRELMMYFCVDKQKQISISIFLPRDSFMRNFPHINDKPKLIVMFKSYNSVKHTDDFKDVFGGKEEYDNFIKNLEEKFGLISLCGPNTLSNVEYCYAYC